MFDLSHVVEKCASYAGEFLLTNQKTAVDELRGRFSSLDDESLKQACHNALRGTSRQRINVDARSHFGVRIVSRLLGLRYRASETILANIALASEAFSRTPADLPPGSRLFPQQVRASVALTQRYVLQMDTGEGKTYALLPAAFALACEYGRVYIVCASEYLAWRDASRTRQFWDSVGVNVGFAADSHSTDWSTAIVYTTLAALLFKVLSDEMNAWVPLRPVIYGSVLLDDADAVLLDQTDQEFIISHSVEGHAFDWSAAISLAQTLDPDRHIVIDRGDLSAALTVEGEEFLLRSLPPEARGSSSHLLRRTAVEASFLATRVVQENVDYCIEDGRVLPIDRVTGRVQGGQTMPWMLPLEFSLGTEPRSTSLQLHAITPSVFFQEFQHVAGMSGTIKGDVSEYVLSYHVWTATIPRRLARYNGLKPDLIFKTRDSALAFLGQRVVEIAAAGRPVLVGTQTIEDAERASHALKQLLPPQVRLEILTGKNESDIAGIFERAGEPGTVVVATQLAGRGIDIRLTESAKANGGLALFGLAHSVTERHDLQFIGRAGRQGDPFSAQFIWSLEDAFMNAFMGGNVRVIKDIWGKNDFLIESPFLSRTIRMNQARWQQSKFMQRLNQLFTQEADIQVRHSFTEWVEYLQALGVSTEADDSDPAFLDWVTRRFVEGMVPIVDHRHELTLEESDDMVRRISSGLELPANHRLLTSADVEGLGHEACREAVNRALMKGLQSAFEANRSIRRRIREASDRRDEIDRRHDDLQSNLLFAEELLESVEERKAAADIPGPSVIANEPPPNDGAIETEKNAAHFSESGPVVARDVQQDDDERDDDEPDDEHDDDEWYGEALFTLRTDEEQTLPTSVDEVEHYYVSMLHRINYALDEASPTDWPALEQRIQTIHAWLKSEFARVEEELQAEPPVNEKLLGRSARLTAYWTLKLAWFGFLQERRQIRNRAALTGFSSLDYGRYVSDRIVQRWVQVEADLPRQMLRNLLKCADLEQLDNLFRLEDFESHDNIPTTRETLPWDPPAEQSSTDADLEEGLIKQFVLTNRDELRRHHLVDEAIVRRVLRDFVNASPLRSLQTTQQVLAALNESFVLDLERGVVRRRARMNRQCIRLFLVFLRQRGLVGKLPTTNQWLTSNLKRAAASLSERSGLLYAAFGVAFFVLFGVVSGIHGVVKPHVYHGLLRLIDDVAFAGWLADGRITAPAMPILIFGWYLTFLLIPWASSTARGMTYDRLLTLPLQLAAAWWMTDWPVWPWNGVGMLRSLFVFGSVFAAAWITQKFVWGFAATSGISLEAGWLCWTIPVVALPRLVTTHDHFLGLALSVSGLVSFFMILMHRSHLDIRLVSSSSVGVDVSQAELITHNYRTPIYTGLGAHLFPALITWLVCDIRAVVGGAARFAVLGSPGVGRLIPIGTYVATLIIWVWLVTGRRFSYRAWRMRLNQSRQVFEDAISDTQIAQRLDRLRRQALAKELVLQMLALSAALVLLSPFGLMPNGMPIALMIVSMVSLWATMLDQFVAGVYKHFFSRIPFAHSVLDLATMKEPQESQEEFFERLKHFFHDRVALTFVIMSVLFEVVNLLLRLFRPE